MSKRIMVDMSATIIHHGHIRLLKKAAAYGNVVVGLTTDEEILKKKKFKPELKFDFRKEILESIKYVYEVVPTKWKINEATLKKYNIDLVVHGSDNSNEIEKDKLIIFSRTEGVSSSNIRKKASDIVSSVKRKILLNPGPGSTTDSVKKAQLVPDICPREKEFGNIMDYISLELTSFVADKNKFSTILFNGSGTAAIEAILTSVVPSKKSIIIINNGSYGHRMCKIALRYNLNFIEFKSSKLKPINLGELEKLIITNKNLSHIAIVHNETTTGLLNDIDKVGVLSKKYNLKLIVDAMSSYGAIPINMEKSHISFLAASSNKNLQGLPGVSFVIAKNGCLNELKEIKQLTYYLSLRDEYEYFNTKKQARFTPPVQTIYALKQAIKETKIETIQKRYDRYKKSWNTLIKGLKELGLSYIIDDENHSKIITSIEIPPNINFEDLHDFFYTKDITIYPGKIEEFNTFRIANIGDIDFKDIKSFLMFLNSYIKKS